MIHSGGMQANKESKSAATGSATVICLVHKAQHPIAQAVIIQHVHTQSGNDWMPDQCCRVHLCASDGDGALCSLAVQAKQQLRLRATVWYAYLATYSLANDMANRYAPAVEAFHRSRLLVLEIV